MKVSSDQARRVRLARLPSRLESVDVVTTKRRHFNAVDHFGSARAGSVVLKVSAFFFLFLFFFFFFFEEWGLVPGIRGLP